MQAANSYTSTPSTSCGKADQRVAHSDQPCGCSDKRRFQGRLERSDLPLADREAVKEASASSADQILLAAATRLVREIPKVDTRRIANEVVVSDHRGSLAA